jgi:hypothetical protein
VAVAGDARVHRDPADLEASDVDVDVGQQRRVRVAGFELGQAHQPGARDLDRLDVDMVAEIGQRPVVERRFRRDEECALGILQGEAVKLELAEQRALDPLHVDVEARRHFHVVDLPHDIAMPERRVQPDEEGPHHRHEHEEADARPLGGGAGAVAAARNRGGGSGRVLDGTLLCHQNA